MAHSKDLGRRRHSIGLVGRDFKDVRVGAGAKAYLGTRTTYYVFWCLSFESACESEH